MAAALLRSAMTLGFVLMASAPAFAHAALRQAEPKEGVVLSKAPAQVALVFSEELQPGVSRVEVKQQGRVISAGKGVLDPQDHKRLVVTLKNASKGSFQVI